MFECNDYELEVIAKIDKTGATFKVPRAKDYLDFVNRSVLIFGPSNSGKTTLILDMIKNLSSKIPVFHLFSNSEPENRIYEGIIPQPLIYHHLEFDILHNIVERQSSAAKLYKIANNKKILFSIIEKLSINYRSKEFATFETNSTKIINDLIKNNEFSKAKEMREQKDKSIIDYLKCIIKKNMIKRKNLFPSNLTDIEKTAIKFLNFNPNIGILFDDCTTELEKLAKDKKTKNREHTGSQLLQEVFYRSRHTHITPIFGLHNDVSLPPEMRKNAQRYIFCSAKILNAFLNNKQNGFDKDTTAKLIAASNAIFNTEFLTHRKILFNSSDPIHPIKYIKATQHSQFKVCSQFVWNFCDKIKKEDFVEDDNFFKEYL